MELLCVWVGVGALGVGETIDRIDELPLVIGGPGRRPNLGNSNEKFTSFATKPIADTKSNVAGLFSLSADNVEEVNSIVTNGLKAGGTEPNEMRDYGFMQQRTIEDPDGHTWEIFFMDMSKCPTGQGEQ